MKESFARVGFPDSSVAVIRVPGPCPGPGFDERQFEWFGVRLFERARSRS